MKKYSIIVLILGLVLFSCKKEVIISTNLSDIGSKGLRMGEKLNVEVNADGSKIAETELIVNGKSFKGNSLVLDSTNAKLGMNTITFKVKPDGGEMQTFDQEIVVLSPVQEKNISYEVVKEYPHNTSLFTEGFFYENGQIWESAGMENNSKIVKYTLGSTQMSQEVPNKPEIFAEGLVKVGNKVYQMTYRNRVLYQYDANFKLEKEMPMPTELAEGWGCTTDGTYIYVTDSTADIKVFDANFKYVRTITVTGYNETYPQVNELEYINGLLYANVFMKNNILVINPKTGQVLSTMDCTDLVTKNQTNQEAVLNGIAYNPATQNLLLTGKNWAKIYEVKIKN